FGFEPVTINYENLMKSKKENHLTNFDIFNIALANENIKAPIFIPECTDNASFSRQAAVANMKRKDYEVETVDCVRFDDWIKDHPEYSNVGLIKIDAQGSEFDIVSGMKEFLTNAHDISVIAEYENHLQAQGHTFAELDALF